MKKTAVCPTYYDIFTFLIIVQSESVSSDYHPTVGTRILEFENVIGNSTIDIELWDCSGKEEYETCWPAMAYQCDGTLNGFSFVFVL